MAAIRKIATITLDIEGIHCAVTVHRDSEWKEYQCRVVGGTEAQTYFTGDKQDALGTAQLMVQQLYEQQLKAAS